MKPFFLSLVLLSSLCCFSQSNTDSLIRLAEKENNASKKIDLYLRLSSIYNTTDLDSSFLFAKQAAELSQKTNDAGNLAEAEQFLTIYYLRTGKPDSVYFFTQKNIKSLSGNKNKFILLSKFYNLEGNYFMRNNNQRKALEDFYQSLRIADQSGDALSRIKALVNIGWAQMELNQFETSISESAKAVALMKENNIAIYPSAYNNMASCFGAIGKLDSAEKYALAGTKAAHDNSDLPAEANGLNILGDVYSAQGKKEKALQTFLQAKDIRKKIGDMFYVVSDLSSISELYASLDQPEKGTQAALEALDIAQKNGLSAKLPIIYTALVLNYEKAGRYQDALSVYKKLDAIKDSIYTNASPQALAEMRTRYETEKKELIIEQQHNRLRFQNFLFIGIAGLILLLILLAQSQYKRYRLKQEARMKEELMKQQQVAAKAVMEAEEEERNRIARDLHDGVGQMMSAAKMNLSAFESDLQFNNEEQKNSFEKIIQLVDESCKEVRSVSHNMMPNALLKKDLATAIADFIDKLDKKELHIQLHTEGLNERLDSNVETVLYRVVQECVNNVIKHADATELDISIIRDKDGISGTIEDNGKGFDKSNSESDGIGLKNILTRIDYLKGTVDFDSQPGRGTVVALHVPL